MNTGSLNYTGGFTVIIFAKLIDVFYLGMLAATAVLENGWKPGMAEEEAKKLVRDAIAAGIINDMGSGSNVDLAVIKPNDDCTVRIINTISVM